MKLLLDQNLSRKLVRKIQRQFPGSSHVIFCDLASADDRTVWGYARENGFAVVTKDADFSARSVSDGFPPKVIWLRMGNARTDRVEAVLKARTKDIKNFDEDKKSGCLIIKS